MATRRVSVILLTLCASQALAQAVVSGTVKDSLGRTLREVEVSSEQSSALTRTDSAGRYLLRVSSGDHVIRFRLIGYSPIRRKVHLRIGEVVRIDADLAPGDIQQLTPIEVVGPRPRGLGREAFEERRALGFGKFIDSTVLRRSEGRRLSELLRESGLRVVYTKGGSISRALVANPTQANMDGSPKCYLSVILDNVVLFRSGSDEPPPDFSRDFSIMSLESVEVYRSVAQTPVEFVMAGRSECGVIVLWTRRH